MSITKPMNVLVASEYSGTVDRKSTRLNSSHRCISYAVLCLKKKKKIIIIIIKKKKKNTTDIAT